MCECLKQGWESEMMNERKHVGTNHDKAASKQQLGFFLKISKTHQKPLKINRHFEKSQ